MKNNKLPIIELERRKADVTMRELSEKIGFSRTAYRRWLIKGDIPSAQLAKLADFYGVSTDYLLGR